MDFKHFNNDNRTPNSVQPNPIVSKVLSNAVACDSPFRLLPKFSTPPSRFAKIINPFEPHLNERLHLPMFSPTVFAQRSTPKSGGKFKWNIDEISNLHPADIDEETINQHVHEYDSAIESVMQEKIDMFFSENAIVPSPVTTNDLIKPLLPETPKTPTESKPCTTSSTQTVLTLPPILPKHIEDALQPFCTYTHDQQSNSVNSNSLLSSSIYRQLFEFEQKSPCPSVESSPALSTGLSPIQFSPLGELIKLRDSIENTPLHIPKLRDCNISPINVNSPREMRSACRLNFSGKMSVDSSIMLVPDIGDQICSKTDQTNTDDVSLSFNEMLSDSSSSSPVVWEMEYKQFSTVNSPVEHTDQMDVSIVNTPHSKIFSSQRKRLSDSFKMENDNNVNELIVDDNSVDCKTIPNKLFRENVTDAGYQTDAGTICEEDSHLFASTPSKKWN